MKHPTLDATEFELGIGIGSIPAEILKLLSQVASDHSSLPQPESGPAKLPPYFLGGLELKAAEAAEAGPPLKPPPIIEEVIRGSEVRLRL